jgi:PKD repeat protein
VFVILWLALCGAPCLSEGAGQIEKDLQSRFHESRRLVASISQKLTEGLPVAADLIRLKSIATDVRSFDLLLQDKFRSQESEMAVKGPKARDRQRIMSEGYRQALQEYLSLIDSIPPEGMIQQSTLDALQSLLDKFVYKKKRPIMGSLPYRNLSYPSKEPSADPSVKPAYKGGNKIVSPEDTKSIEEAPISNDIATLAQSLNWNPVSIYEYVKNNVETEWYWGCMKGAEETLRQKSGNDCDQATLLIALLRASGFPCRHVRGTMEFFAGGQDVVMEKIKNLTGVEEPLKIAEFFQRAGIPYKPLISGGTITNFQIEHIWVESQIPYANYRGNVIDDQGKTWLGLDTSIKVKGYAYNQPEDIFQLPGLSALLSGVRNDYLNAVRTQMPLQYFEEKLSALGSQQTTDNCKQTRSLIPEVMNILPASMQFDQKKITHEYTAMPDDLKHKVRFIASDPRSPAPGSLFDITLNTMELSNRQIAISYEPETVEDQEIIDSYGGLDTTPAYLVRLRPVLKIDGAMVVAGRDGMPMGTDYELAIELISPNGTERVANTQITGNLAVVGITAGRVTPSSSPLPQEGGNAGASGGAPSEGDDAETILFKEASSYIDRWNRAEDELASLLHLVIARPLPVVVTVGGVVDVTYLLDMPHGFEWKGLYVDAGLRATEVTPSQSPLPQGGSQERQKAFMQISALQGSVLENRIFEDDLQVESVSTAKLMQLCNQQQSVGCQLVIIDKSNIDSVLPTLTLDENMAGDIRNAVNQNLVVRIPQRKSNEPSAISYLDWTGMGYIKEDPTTGEAGYMLSGMLAGGMTAVSPGKWSSSVWRNILSKPYSGNAIDVYAFPLSIYIAFPFDGLDLSVSPIDVEGRVNYRTATVEVNGIRAVVLRDGRFIASGVPLAEGMNQITAKATNIDSTTASQTISVNYHAAQPAPIALSIVSPTAGSVINGPDVIVKGTVATSAQEVSIKVNGMLADVYGNRFVVNRVPLREGNNVITAYATDSNGAAGRAEVTVRAVTGGPRITLSANITSGIPSLTTYFSVSTSLPNAVASYRIDFEGDGVIDYTGTAFEDITYTYATEGIFYPTVTVTDDQGNTYSDTIAITVLNRAEIDALLKGKWEGMKGALAQMDVEKAASNFLKESQERYRYIFTNLSNMLPNIVANMQSIEMITVEDGIAEYRIKKGENVGEVTYYIYFVMDSNGIWKIRQF